MIEKQKRLARSRVVSRRIASEAFAAAVAQAATSAALRALALPWFDPDAAADAAALDAAVRAAFEDAAAIMGFDDPAVLDAFEVVLAAPHGRATLFDPLYVGLFNASADGDADEARWALEALFAEAEQVAAAQAATSAALRALDLPPLELAAADEAAVHGAAVTAAGAFDAAAQELGMDVPVLLAYNMVAASARGFNAIDVRYRALRAACLAGDADEARAVVEGLVAQGKEVVATRAALRALDLPPLEPDAADEVAWLIAAGTASWAFGRVAAILDLDSRAPDAFEALTASPAGRIRAITGDYRLLRDFCVAGDVKQAASVVEQVLLQAGMQAR